jgi:(2Fe-2S) ferredoxin
MTGVPLRPRVPLSYYERHVFFCCNQRDNGEACCNNHGSQKMRDYAKVQVKQLGLSGVGKVRVNRWLPDRCDEGPVIVVYPRGLVHVRRPEDVDEIIHEHLLHGRVVERLRI